MDGKILAAPVKVSPFIKLARWSLLFYGIYYGRRKWYYYNDIVQRKREEYQKMKPILDSQRAAKDLETLTAELKKLAEEMEIPLSPDWTARGI